MRGAEDLGAWCCAGVLLGASVLAPAHRAAGRNEPVAPRAADALDVRELRRLDGIGPRRALAIVRARWNGLRGGPDAWRAVGGIGDATVRAAAEALERGAVEAAGAPAYTRPRTP